MNFNPTRDWVVLPIPNKKVTDSGILLSDEAANSLKSNILQAVKVGPECKQVKEGDTVYVHPHTEGVIIDVEGTQYVMVNEFMLLGVINK
jgi:co-chaperonin GroES (HSP10)